ncbi:glycoside hydrolase family 2 TIM barrel-domain containing protein [Foetidibacter luteolus]|uniref:glycoside hydrolase family 2 TIM barrel-domain containing protein n=1 Tax=Foetidibacter luteolus TaxID=2608880 RepID=UPI00129C0DF1|nr:glycoside hydrolase family 2 TIM barrel-domain containing protein [Foetidibacter luteolus]
MRKSIVSAFLFFFFTASVKAQSNTVAVKMTGGGSSLIVNGKEFFINGMNWDYFPIGTNYSYSLWKQPDDIIQAALDYEMPLLRTMGVNTIRQYTGVPARWIKYIYENYGIYTVLNHSFGRYGLTLKGKWAPNTDYSSPLVKELLLSEVKDMVNQYKNTPGVLMFLLGNENNYGLFWRGAETENIPVQDRKSTKDAQHLYRLFNDAVKEIKAIDVSHPAAICNGDLLFLDIIAKECTDVDVLGINSYRGFSFTDLYERVKKEYGKPVMLTEFGADAYNSLANEEDQEYQAKCLVSNWKEMYANAAGMGKSGNSLGGFTFQFSDGWWKTGQTLNLDEHDADASWANGGYLNDFKPGENNMNEEWFGICAKGKTNERGIYTLYPRAAYYALKEIHKINPYSGDAQVQLNHFGNAEITEAMLRARGDKAASIAEDKGKIYLSDLQANFTTYNTGGSLISTPDEVVPNSNTYPNRLGFDRMESFNIGITAKPSSNVTANVQFNVLGNVAENPIDEVFYENRGRKITVNTPTGTVQVNSNNRLQLYRSSISWNARYFKLNAFYRTGHNHWGYEGDFFGLYQEANYGPNIDIYNGEAPFGFEIEGKKAIKGLKVAFGPELWWGANPAVLVKYSRNVAQFTVTGIFHEDITQRSGIQSSIAVPVPKTRKAAMSIARKFGNFGFDLGGLWAGQPLNGRTFQLVRNTGGNEKVFQDEIKSKDNFGSKIKFTYTGGAFKWYGQGAYMGLVANGGPDQTKTFTGWRLKDCGSGNQYNVLSGFTYNHGSIQIAPNFLYQKPIEGPIPSDALAPARPRNILDDPFAVRSNRETVAGELLLTYDPTPATWMYEWDNDRAEDAKFAMSADFVYRHLPTIQDAAIGILANGRTLFAFPGSAPAQNLWEVNTRFVSKVNPDLGLIANFYIGNAQANGNDKRTINRTGIDIRTIYKKIKLATVAKFNDWGPFDYHRDFNLTFPLQLMADISTEVGKPDWFILPSTKIGIRGTYRTLNKYSPRYSPVKTIDASGNWVPDPNAIGFPDGNEWEIRTYIQINLGR